MPYFTNRGITPLPVGGSFNTFDPATKSAFTALFDSDKTATTGSGGTNGSGAFGLTSFAHTTGRYYCEFTIVLSGGSGAALGVGLCDSTWLADVVFLGATSHSAGYYADNTSTSNFDFLAGFTFTTADVIGMAVDLNVSPPKVYITKNGSTWGNSGNPTAGTGGAAFNSISGLTAPFRPALELERNGDSVTVNFGASAYAYTVPSGYSNW